MKDQALEIVRDIPDLRVAQNRLREYLQHVILRKLFELNLNRDLVFHGGTALRIIHGSRRFSEDIDFHTAEPQPDLKFEDLAVSVQKELQLSGYDTSLKVWTDKPVKGMFIKFTGLLYDAGLSPHPNQNLNIKLKIDTNPPLGFRTERATINRYLPFSVIHHNPETFFSGKLMAVLQRSYTKGRDYFDLMFYLSRWPGITPNVDYLQSSLKQMGTDEMRVNGENWQDVLREHLQSVDWASIHDDLRPFMEDETDLRLVNSDTMLRLL